MVWFKVDDGLPEHEKTDRVFDAAPEDPIAKGDEGSLRALAAIGLWALGGASCAGQLTDGHISHRRARRLAQDLSRDEVATLSRMLADAELWHEADGGHEYHDWTAYQPTRDKVEEKRRKTAERVAKHKAKKREASERANPGDNGGGNGVTADVGNGVTSSVANAGANPAPDPTRPDPKRERGDAPSSAMRQECWDRFAGVLFEAGLDAPGASPKLVEYFVARCEQLSAGRKVPMPEAAEALARGIGQATPRDGSKPNWVALVQDTQATWTRPKLAAGDRW